MMTKQGCLPCLYKNAVVLLDTLIKEDSVRKSKEQDIINLLTNSDPKSSPPVLYHSIIKTIVDDSDEVDLYKSDRVLQNKLALSLEKMLRDRVKNCDDPFEEALKISIAGNSIDIGAYGRLSVEDIEADIHKCLKNPLDKNAVDNFRNTINKADNILFLGDNAGEIVFDKIFIEAIDYSKITYVVRGKPVLNDVTYLDAEQVGISELVEVIDNGNGVPGTMLSKCSDSFMKFYKRADLVIAKGQGNYETLSDVTGKNIYFLFKVKCPVIAEMSELPLNSLAILHSKNHI